MVDQGLQGQWFGFTGGDAPAAQMTVDIDPIANGYRGSAFFFPFDEKLPGTYAPIQLNGDMADKEFEVPIIPLDRMGAKLDEQNLATRYPGVVHAKSTNVSMVQNGDELEVTFKLGDPIGLGGRGVLKRAPAAEVSSVFVEKNVSTWSDFKTMTSSFSYRQYLFRGQPCTKRLRTSFHRTNRSDLVQFIEYDAMAVLDAVTPLTRHYYDRRDAAQMGAFYSLMQHHGYPTPFLDWSLSPFIAAYFAFRRIPVGEESVRIFMLDLNGWQSSYPARPALTLVPPHISFIQFQNIENPRSGPQQAVSTATNIDDIEGFIRLTEDHLSRRFLVAVDLNAGERTKVLADLEMMGITAASLFPGLDGAFETQKIRLFGYDA